MLPGIPTPDILHSFDDSWTKIWAALLLSARKAKSSQLWLCKLHLVWNIQTRRKDYYTFTLLVKNLLFRIVNNIILQAESWTDYIAECKTYVERPIIKIKLTVFTFPPNFHQSHVSFKITSSQLVHFLQLVLTNI